MMSSAIRLVLCALCALVCWSDVKLLVEASYGSMEPSLSPLGWFVLLGRAAVLLVAAASVWIPAAWLFGESE